MCLVLKKKLFGIFDIAIKRNSIDVQFFIYSIHYMNCLVSRRTGGSTKKRMNNFDKFFDRLNSS